LNTSDVGNILLCDSDDSSLYDPPRQVKYKFECNIVVSGSGLYYIKGKPYFIDVDDDEVYELKSIGYYDDGKVFMLSDISSSC
jgi:hypothetical protein